MNIENASIWNCLNEGEKSRVQFVKPSPGQGLTILLESPPAYTSPSATVLSVRELEVKTGQVIPFHVHHHKEKLYVFQSGYWVIVLMYDKKGNRWTNLTLDQDNKLICIPPGTIHAVMGPDGMCGQCLCKILVISSSKDAEDITWESATEQLLKNEHLNPSST